MSVQAAAPRAGPPDSRRPRRPRVRLPRLIHPAGKKMDACSTIGVDRASSAIIRLLRKGQSIGQAP